MFPILYQSPDLILYSYPLLMGIGWGVGYQIFFSLVQISRLKAQALFWGIFLSAWLGAKLLFVLTSGETSYLTSASFWTGGGFVFFGGLLAGAAFLGLFKVAYRSLKLEQLWPILPALTIGHAIGRVGCLLAGCCFGKPTNLFWGIYLHDHNRHPTQLLESLGLFILGAYLLKSKKSKTTLVTTYLLAYGSLRFLIEGLRGDAIRGQWGYITPSQAISLTMIILGLALFKYRKIKGLP